MNTNYKIQALALHLGEDPAIIEVNEYDSCTFTVPHGTYLVCTDEEAGDLYEKEVNDYIDTILYNVPKDCWQYFYRDAFISDALFYGRGSFLDKYSGAEEEVEIDGETLYIYRLD